MRLILLTVALWILAFAVVLIPACSYADVSMTQKGLTEVWCDGVLRSSHTTYHKALQSAIAYGSECTIKQPDISITQQADDMERYKITVSWTAPTKRVNGAALVPGEIDHFTIHQERSDGVAVSAIEVPATSESQYSRVYMLAPGAWTFRATATDKQGQTSDTSVAVIKNLPKY